MSLAVVYGRELDNQPVTFGTTGYTYKRTFVLYDRKTESLWYPMGDHSFTAVSGPRQGEKIPYLQESGVMSLGEWRKMHPDTRVLLGDRSEVSDLADSTAP